MPLTGLTLTGLTLTLLTVPLNLYGDRAGRRGLEVSGKLLASLGFLLCALGAPQALTPTLTSGLTPSALTPSALTLSALTLSALGDALLLWRSDRALLGGLGAFLIAHLCYAGAALAWGPEGGLGGGREWIALGALAGALALGAAVVRQLTPRIPKELRAPSWAYMCVISLMVSACVGRGLGGAWPLMAGALMFWGSDLSVALDRFSQPQWATRAWGIPLYYVAQLTFALSLTLTPPTP
jgi:uncharacterized membrane protein YhhN